MKKNRIIALLLAAGMVLSATACAGDGEGTDTTDTADTADTADTTDASNIAEPTGYDYSTGLDENGYFTGVKASDVVTLPEYKGIEIRSVEEELDYQISMILADTIYDVYEELTEYAVEDGDTVNIDYVGSIDGVEFAGGSTGGAGTTVTIGVTNYIDDFLEQLIGHMPGENFDIEVTFPEDYGNEELNGKDAIFNITINYVQGDLIETVVPEELTEDIVMTYGFESADAMKENIREWIVANRAMIAYSSVAEAATCESFPDSVIKNFKDYDHNQIIDTCASYGMSVEDYLMLVGGYESLDQLIESNAMYYEYMAVSYLTAQAIAELEGLAVTDADIEAAGLTDYIEAYGRPYTVRETLNSYVVPNFVLENAANAD